VNWSSFRTPSSASSWWTNLVAIDKAVPNVNWFVEAVGRNLGNGSSTLFWTQKWIGDAPLSEVFPRLFSLSIQKDSKVCDLLEMEGDRRRWHFNWRRNLFYWEEDLVLRLQEIVDRVVFTL
jgi:hypothetical protein